MSGKNVMALPTSAASLQQYVQLVNEFPVLDSGTEYALAMRWRTKRDFDAAWQLVTSHLRYVVRIARGYRGYGLPQEDLIQEGNVGLMKAVRRFDPERGVRLLAYAVHWIRAYIHEYILRNWRIVKLATTKARRKLFYKLRKAKRSLGRLGVDEARSIAKDLAVTTHDVLDMDSRLSAPDVPYELDSEVRAESGLPEPAAYLCDERTEPERIVAERDFAEKGRRALRAALTSLDARSRWILERRWLNEDDKPATLQELAAELGISAERVRQIESRAIAKLRAAVASVVETPRSLPSGAYWRRRQLQPKGVVDKLNSCSSGDQGPGHEP